MKRRSSDSETSSVVGPALTALNAIPGVLAIRLQAGRRGGVRLAATGTPDILLVVRGKAVFLEAKRPGGKATPAQLEWHRRASLAGGRTFIVTDVHGALQVAEWFLAGEPEDWP